MPGVPMPFTRSTASDFYKWRPQGLCSVIADRYWAKSHMKVFISWSGELSRRVADSLHKHLPLMIQGLDVFMSKNDIESGSRWSQELSRQLEETSFGIICLTAENLTAPWLLFEAGALTKHVEGRAAGLLIGNIQPSELAGPISQFQCRQFTKAEFKSLLSDLNKRLELPLSQSAIDALVDKWWDDLLLDHDDATREAKWKELSPNRPDRELLEELLVRTRAIEREINPTDDKFDPIGLADGLRFLTKDELSVLKSIVHEYEYLMNAPEPYPGCPGPRPDAPDHLIDSLVERGFAYRKNGAIFPHKSLVRPILEESRKPMPDSAK